MTDGRMHTPHSRPLDPPLAVTRYRNYQKSLAYVSYLAPLILFVFTKRQSQKGGGGMAQCPSPPKYSPAVMNKKGLLVLRGCPIKNNRLDLRYEVIFL